MPKIKVALVVEFDADNSDQNTIDLALDQILHFQPSCIVVSKRIIEIDGIAASVEEDLSSAGAVTGIPRSPLTTGHRHSAQTDSYRPDHSGRIKDQPLDSYRPGTLNGHGASSRNIDSYRPGVHVSSDAAAIHPDRQNTMTVSNGIAGSRTANGGLSSSAILGTRYDALADNMVFTSDTSFMTHKNNSRTRRSGSHYSPPPCRDRSASPQNGRRRSERLRSAPSRNISKPETSHNTKLERWKQRRDEEMKRVETKPDSLADLASIFSVKGEARFEKQRERHGITEALRLKNLRSNQRIEKTKHQSDKRRWGGAEEEGGGVGEVKQGARMDAVIDQIASFDFSVPPSGLPNGDASGHSATHPPVETRKKKGAGAKKRGRGKAAGIHESELEDLKRAADHEMQDTHPYTLQLQQLWEQQMQNQTSSTGIGIGDMAVDAAEAEWVDVPDHSSDAIAVAVSEEQEGVA